MDPSAPKPRTAMQRSLRSFALPALIGLALVLPFMLMEWLNRRAFHEPYPVALFIILWVLPTSCILLIRPMIRSLRAGEGLGTYPMSVLARTAMLALLAAIWITMLKDQMPCFLGALHCG